MNARLLLLCAVLLLPACTVGPDYRKPLLKVPAGFRQMQGWKTAQPADLPGQGNWWQLYRDDRLDALIQQMQAGNQSLAASEARYRQARALVQGSRARLLPELRQSADKTRSGNADSTSNSYNLSTNASWEIDLWGKLRRQLQSDTASLEASSADLAAARLSLAAELTQNYLQLRVLDEQKRLLERSVAAYRRSLNLTENQYRAGIVPKSDVSQALTQLKNTEAQSIDLQYRRAQLEHAIAVLLGVPPADFSLDESPEIPALPLIPQALPSALLERRPDIAAAERRVFAANASIGVEQAAWYPDLTLSAAGGWRSGSFDPWLNAPNRFWSLGSAFAMPMFDGGRIRSRVARAEALYEQTVADYRQTVLQAFREVEDALVQLAVLEREYEVQQQALDAAQESLRLIENQYRAGTVDYNAVINVQTSALSSERSLLELKNNQLAASLALLKALGGDFEQEQLEQEPPMQPR